MTAHLSPLLKQATPVVVDHALGSWIHGTDGRDYLDFTTGIGVTSTGHCHPRVVAAAQAQCANIIHAQYTTVMHRPLLELTEKLGGVPEITLVPTQPIDIVAPTATSSWKKFSLLWLCTTTPWRSAVPQLSQALPAGTTTLKGGTRVEYGIVEGRRGAQALSVRVLDAPQSVEANRRVRDRKPADEMVVIVEDLIRLLDDVEGSLRRGRYPDKQFGSKVAQVLRAVAADLEV